MLPVERKRGSRWFFVTAHLKIFFTLDTIIIVYVILVDIFISLTLDKNDDEINLNCELKARCE